MAYGDDNDVGALFGAPSPLDAQFVLAQNVRKNPALAAPTSGVPQRRTVQRPAAAPQPSMSEQPSGPAVPTPNDMLRQLVERTHQRPDTSAYTQQALERSGRSDRDLMLGMVLGAQGGQSFRPLSQALLARSMKESGDYEIPGGWGTVSRTGEVIWNPAKLNENELSRMTKLYEITASEETKRERDRQRAEDKAEARADRAARSAEARAIAGGRGKFQAVKDRDGNLVGILDVHTGEVSAPPALGGQGGAPGAPGAPGATQFPTQMNPRANESERNTAYQTEALAARQRVIDPEHATPGAWEALARSLLPGEFGEGVANFISPAPRQQARQSQEGTVDALLFLATGAAYNKEQLTQARREFIPLWSDDPPTVAAKRQRVAELAVAARNRSGRAWTQAQEDKLIAAFPEIRQGAGGAPARPASKLPKATVPGRAERYMSGGGG